MNSQQLQCFIYVAERLNFTKAAEALFLSVPTVTHHIKNLEEELGTTLFYRNSRVVKLTEQGEKFFFDAKDIFIRMEKARNRYQNYTEQEKVLFRIGCMTEIELEKLEPVLKQMKECYPHIRPKVIVRDFFELKNLYENQQLEVGISAGGLSSQGSFQKIRTCESYAVMSEEHPLAAQKELHLHQIASENLITLPPKCIPFQKGNKFQEYRTLYAQDHECLVSESEAESILLAKCGYGIAILPGFFIPASNEPGSHACMDIWRLPRGSLISTHTGVVAIPIANTKNIEYGIYYKNKEKHIQTFLNRYKSCMSG